MRGYIYLGIRDIAEILSDSHQIVRSGISKAVSTVRSKFQLPSTGISTNSISVSPNLSCLLAGGREVFS